MSSTTHHANIGKIVLALASHEVGDHGDCSVNDPILTVVDGRRPAHEVLEALSNFSEEKAAGIVAQLECGG
jgi:hypothetical protein